MPKRFRPHDIGQQLLLPPDLRAWLPEGHLALFVSDVVEALDLSEVFASYDEKDGRGKAAYHPRMMTKLLVYGYCIGVTSSRKIERATHEDVAFRVLSADEHPDHDSIAEFRKRHLKALAGLFKQVLKLCRKAGLASLGKVAIDGTKVKANASKHKAMSYGRMGETEKRLEEEVRRLLEEAERVDDEEDAKFGKGKRGDELPEELARRETRLKRIREAKEALEKEAKEQAEREAEEAKARIAERERKARESGKRPGGRPPAIPDPDEAKPEAKAQRNFTDPESRIMLDGATKGFIQGYNAQIAVDGDHQIIVATELGQNGSDNGRLVPVIAQIAANTGKLPEAVLADAGYFSEANVTDPRVAPVDLYVPPNHREGKPAKDGGTGSPKSEAARLMREKLTSTAGKAVYKLRKTIVEPVFGQIKEVRGFRRFSFRGFERASAEWDIVCLTHNLLKLFRSGARVQALG